MQGDSGATAEQIAPGFDVVLDTNPANPVDVAALASRADVAAVAGLVRGTATVEAAHLDGALPWPLTGFDADWLARGTPQLTDRGAAYAGDADVYRAVLGDPTLAIVPQNFLVVGVDSAVLEIGDTFTLVGPGGERRELTIAGIGGIDWVENGALVNRDVTAAVLGPQQIATRAYLAVADAAEAGAVAAALNAAFLAQGADARTFAALGAGGAAGLTGFIALLRGFLAFGLLVGIAGLGVVMVRAVRERRQEIGMLRAMGFGTGLIRAAMLSEAGLIAVQGTVIGAVLGLITTRQMLSGADTFGDGPVPFVVPWAGLLVIVALPLALSLLATAWPASRAARIRPAVALRTAD